MVVPTSRIIPNFVDITFPTTFQSRPFARNVEGIHISLGGGYFIDTRTHKGYKTPHLWHWGFEYYINATTGKIERLNCFQKLAYYSINWIAKIFHLSDSYRYKSNLLFSRLVQTIQMGYWPYGNFQNIQSSMTLAHRIVEAKNEVFIARMRQLRPVIESAITITGF